MTAKKTTKTEAAPEAPKTSNLDAFGARPGTLRHKVNAALTATPKNMKTLMTDAGVEDTFYNYLNSLAKKGLVARTNEGYALANGTSVKAPKGTKGKADPAPAAKKAPKGKKAAKPAATDAA